MPDIIEVNENESLPMDVTFSEVPTSVTWSVFDITTSTELIPATSVTPAANISFEIPPAGFQITDTSTGYNLRELIVTANYSNDPNKQTITTQRIRVRNVAGV